MSKVTQLCMAGASPEEVLCALMQENEELRSLLNSFRDDVLFRIGVGSPYRGIADAYWQRAKAVLSDEVAP